MYWETEERNLYAGSDYSLTQPEFL